MGLFNDAPYYLSAYGIAVKHGYKGTEEQWINELMGGAATAAEAAAESARTAQDAASDAGDFKTAAQGSAGDAFSSKEAAAGSASAAALSAAAAHAYVGELADNVAALVGAWLTDHVDPESEIVIDDSLRTIGAAAEAAAAGNWLEDLTATALTSRRLANTATGNFGIEQGGINSSGLNWNVARRARTSSYISLQGKPTKILMSDPTYTINKVWLYSSQSGSSATRSIDPQGRPCVVIPTSSDKYFRLSISYTGDDEHSMTDADLAAVSAGLKVYTATDTGMTQADVPADAAAVGTRLQDLVDLISDRTTYAIDPAELGWNFGGIDKTGRSNSSTARLRIKAADGKGAVAVRAGSTIEAGAGYKFNVALYDTYISNSNFHLIDYRGPSADSYTVTQDCYIRVGVGTTDDDELWYEDEDGAKVLTPEGEAAETDALTLTLLAGTVKERIEILEDETGTEHILPLDVMPATAEDYHALWDELVDQGFAVRTEIGDVTPSPQPEGEPDLKIYQYTIRRDMNHMDDDYSVIPWDGSNEIYQRPRVLLTCGIHGNERTAPLAVLDFVRRLRDDEAYQELRNGFDWFIIPLVNPWGFSHYAVNKGTGKVDTGTNYSSSTLSNYDVYVCTDEIHQGIRRNAAGIDANRDFDTYNTAEAQAVRDAVLALTAGGDGFAFTLDGHQATSGSTRMINAVCAFMAPHHTYSQETMQYLYRKWMQAAAITETLAAEAYDRPNDQTIYPWVPAHNNGTIRQFMSAYTPYAMTFEGGQTATFYSNSKDWSNPIARAFVNTQYQQFLRILCRDWL